MLRRLNHLGLTLCVLLLLSAVLLWATGYVQVATTPGRAGASQTHNHQADSGRADAADTHEHHGHDHADHALDQEVHAPSQRVAVTREQVTRLGIKISRAAPGIIRRKIRAAAELKVNSDRLAHVVPRAAGIVRQVSKTVGDRVEAGETLAWIESDELAQAKLDFYAKHAEVGCCEIELPRAKAIFENVARLMEHLEQEAPKESLHKLDGLEMGKYRGQLLTTYAAYLSARATHEQEASLHARKVSSDREILDAERVLRQSRAKFHAAMDTARYETRMAYSEAAQARQVAVFDAVAAEKQLRLKGADDDVIAKLRGLVPTLADVKPCLCDNPNCTVGSLPSVSEGLRNDGRFAWYELQAPFAGTVIGKHMALGESIDESTEVFTIADLSSVWVEMVISQAAASVVKAGQTVTLHLPDGSECDATIDYISPLVVAETRTALARATLDNSTGQFRPGTFVDASIFIPSTKEVLVIPKKSVQLVNDHTCVFVWGKADFELRHVKTGITDGIQIEILEGLKPGEAYATDNAFHLKAELAKASGGESGGHGHAH